MLALSSLAWAAPASQAKTATKASVLKPAAALPAPAASAAKSGGLSGGIRVHGQWTIVVRNPDGTVAARRQFENSATFGGVSLLAHILSRTFVPGAWFIVLGNDQGAAGPCPDGGSSGLHDYLSSGGALVTLSSECVLVEGSGIYDVVEAGSGVAACGSFTNLSCSPGLAVTLGSGPSVLLPPPVGAAAVQAVQLQGTIPGSEVQNGNLTAVATGLEVCSSETGSETSLSPAVCQGTVLPSGQDRSGYLFTIFHLPATAPTGQPMQISVIPNQSIEVTVVISFS